VYVVIDASRFESIANGHANAVRYLIGMQDGAATGRTMYKIEATFTERVVVHCIGRLILTE
jgi:hypothetical protein